MKKIMSLILAATMSAAMVLPALASVANEFVEKNDNLYYYVDGNKVVDSWVYSYEFDDDGSWLYFQDNGKAKEDGWITVDGRKYHFTDYIMDYGWLEDGDNTYYLGTEDRGWVVTGWKWIDEDSDSDYETGWYYFNSNGRMVKNQEKKINGEYYVFNEKGLMLDQFVEFSTASDSDAVYKYYKPGNGDRVEGWRWIESGSADDIGMDVEEDSWFYFKNGSMVTADYKTTKIADNVGIVKINGKYYGFEEDGSMVTDFIEGYDGKLYYFDVEDGDMKTGSVKISNESDSDYAGETFYFESAGDNKGCAVTGVKNGYLYDNGRLVKAEDGMKFELVIVDGLQYLVNESGKVRTNGTVKDGNDEKWMVSKNADGSYNVSKVVE